MIFKNSDMFASISLPHKSGFFSREYHYLFLVALTTRITTLIKEVFLSNIKFRISFNRTTPYTGLGKFLFSPCWKYFSNKPFFQQSTCSSILGPSCKLKTFSTGVFVRYEMYHVVSMIVGTSIRRESVGSLPWVPFGGTQEREVKAQRSFSFPVEKLFKPVREETFVSTDRHLISTTSMPNIFLRDNTVCEKEFSKQKMSESISSENSDDFIVFESSLLAESDQNQESESEVSSSEESSEDGSCSSDDDENGWTSDCEQLCISLMQHSSSAKSTSSFTKKASETTHDTESSDENILSFNQHEDFRPQRQPIPADKNLCWNSENDSGIGSGSSNPSDSSTGDEDAASKDMNQIRSCTLSNVFSPNSRKLTRNISCPSIISRPITLSVLPLEATWCNDTLGPDSPVYLRSDPSNESDWESDTESEDVETHYPSRTTKSKVKTAANAKLSDDASATEWDTGLLKNCFCSSKTILKCSFCVELRKTNSHSTHERTVWFPESNRLETTYLLDESDEENDEPDEIHILYCYPPFSYQQQSLYSGSASSFSNCNSSPTKSRSSRKSPWEMFARDRLRFQRKIAQRYKDQLSAILDTEHRLKIYNSRFKET